MKLTLIPREKPSPGVRIILPIIATGLALLTSSIYVALAGADIVDVYYYLITWPLANPSEIFVTATPLTLLAFSILIAFRARFWNIGAHGQFIIGGLMSAWLGVVLGSVPQYLLIPLMFTCSWLAGSAVALISWWLKTKKGQDEVLTTILIWSAILLINAGLLTGPLRSPYTTYPQSQEISINAKLPVLIPDTRLHAGVIAPFIIMLLLWFLMSRTTFGVKVTAVTNPRAAILEGIDVSRVYFWVCFLSGGIAGLAGAIELMGILFYMTPFVGPNYGLVALAIAMLGNLDVIGATIASLFFSIIINGANAMAWSTGVPSFLADLIQAQTLVFFIVLSRLVGFRLRIFKQKEYKIKHNKTPLKLDYSQQPKLRTFNVSRKLRLRIIFFILFLAVLYSLEVFPQSNETQFVRSVLTSVLALTITITTPITLASVGETLSEKGGSLNLGILGIMISGAAWGFMGAYFFNDIFVGILLAIAVGALLGLLLAFLIVTLGAQQHIAGIAVTFFSMNLAYFFHRILIGSPLVEPKVPLIPVLRIPLLESIPVVGVIFKQNIFVYFGIFIIPLIIYLVFTKTRWGLVITAVGENPKSADALGVRVHFTRYLAIMFGGILMALGGSFYSLVDIRAFNLNVGGEWSWIALALVVLGNWKVQWVWVATLLFGLLNAVQTWLVTVVVQIPYQFFQAIPYVLTIGAGAFLGKRVRPPKALLTPYRREGN
ncbi:sugar ABC transporter permease [Candidatus Caldarchaeum subterraneum]|uniref:Sugar ABC transporter permease n=1 Tax=Caldiarchaeum subterraneum TaxID=311458 RepID=E6N5J1_CALS0|nr:sugar ABC transporter permease [Candidatus Caldarchaeum subterraneum]BAJ50394.1 sugar ABC transporter permease [Candidatus Caldarchaeum subterraneum]